MNLIKSGTIIDLSLTLAGIIARDMAGTHTIAHSKWIRFDSMPYQTNFIIIDEHCGAL